MKVAELIEHLQKCDPTHLVLIETDAELRELSWLQTDHDRGEVFVGWGEDTTLTNTTKV